MTPLTIAVTLIMLLLAAGLGAFFYLLRHPPVIHVDIGDVRADVIGTLDVTQAIPALLTVRVQAVPPDAAPTTINEEPMPLDVLDYIDAESDEWARISRRRHARALRSDLGGWTQVLAALKREDGVVEEPKPE